MTRKTIKVENLARVEGEGALTVTIRDGKVKSAALRIFEPPRFFEAFLRGRAFSEAPDITARICGICPVAYQMSSVHAMEDALGVTVGGPLRDLRRLLYCGEWIESHALHIYLLHAPDFLGFEGAIDMARDHADLVQRGLALKKAGNEMMALLGGREIHPINVRVGGFYKVPDQARSRRPRRAAEVGARQRRRHGPLGGRLRFPGLPARLRVRRAPAPRRIPLQRGPHRLEPRPRHHGPRIRRSISRKSTSPTRPRCNRAGAETGTSYLCRAARPLQPQLRPPLAARPGGGERGRARHRPAPIPIRASSCARSRCSTPATRRSASSPPTSRRSGRRCRSSRGRASATPPPRRRAACSSTATGSTPTAPSSTPASCRRPRRTRRASRRT